MPSDSDRQQAQESRARYLRDPEAGDGTRMDTAESVQSDAEGPPWATEEAARAGAPQDFLAEHDEPQVASVLIGAQVTDDGIAIEILIPWESVGFGNPLAQHSGADLPNTLDAHAEDGQS